MWRDLLEYGSLEMINIILLISQVIWKLITMRIFRFVLTSKSSNDPLEGVSKRKIDWTPLGHRLHDYSLIILEWDEWKTNILIYDNTLGRDKSCDLESGIFWYRSSFEESTSRKSAWTLTIDVMNNLMIKKKVFNMIRYSWMTSKKSKDSSHDTDNISMNYRVIVRSSRHYPIFIVFDDEIITISR